MAEGDDNKPATAPQEQAPEIAPPPVELRADELRGHSPLSPDELVRAGRDGAHELLGQQRALDAIRMAIGIGAPGYNVYVSRASSRRERESIIRLLQQRAAAMPTPGDWVYVNNFKSPESPAAIYLRGGQGVELRDGMRDLVSFLIEQLPKAFRREDFDQERKALREKYNRRAQELFSQLENAARERGFAIQGTTTGQVVFIPLIGGKAPESPEDLNRKMQELPEAERERLAKAAGRACGPVRDHGDASAGVDARAGRGDSPDRTHLRRAADRARHRRAQGALRQPGRVGLSRPGCRAHARPSRSLSRDRGGGARRHAASRGGAAPRKRRKRAGSSSTRSTW